MFVRSAARISRGAEDFRAPPPSPILSLSGLEVRFQPLCRSIDNATPLDRSAAGWHMGGSPASLSVDSFQGKRVDAGAVVLSCHASIGK